MLFGVPYTLARSVLQAQEKVALIVKADALQTASKVGFFLLLAFFVQSAVSAAWAILLSLAISLALALWYLRRVPLRPVFAPIRRHLGTVLRYSTPLAIVSFGPLVVHQADRLMLGALATTSAVGLYALASSLAVVLGTLHNSLVSVFMPIASQAYRNKASRDIETSYLFISKWIGLANGLLLIVFVGLGHEILSIVGKEFATTESYHVLLMLTAFYFFATWVGPTGALLRMSDGQHLELINTVVFIAVNVILNYFLITWLGVIGAALATLCSGILLNILQVIEIFYRNKFLPVTRKHLEILVIVALGFCLCLFVDIGPAIRAVLSVLVAGVIGLYAVYTMTETEKSLVRSLATKMRTRLP
jgi:O-antigen/teichoic acid export membrane protein